MEALLAQFLKKHCDPSKPVLIALSGGPDSLALYSLLLEYHIRHPLKLGVAHVDHRWREQSAAEAQLLQEKVTCEGVVFHLKVLDPSSLKGNLEAACRAERLAFFKTLCQQHGYQAVLVAHHADDVAETVLKKVMEGCSLSHLSSMREVSDVEGVTLWRPFLPVHKRDLQQWLHSRHLKGFEDHTNGDPKYMRGRMRTRILPHLAQEFGKDIVGSLKQLDTEALELRHYLEERIALHLYRIHEGAYGLFFDFTEKEPLHPFEIKYLIRRLCEMKKISLSKQGLETALQCLLSRVADKELRMGDATLFIDRGRLFLTKNKFKPMTSRYPLKIGHNALEGYDILVKQVQKGQSPSHWKEAWQGNFQVWLPEGNYQLGPAQANALYPRSGAIADWWTDAKVPAFLRRWIPVIWEGERLRHEFLTGKSPLTHEYQGNWLEIKCTC